MRRDLRVRFDAKQRPELSVEDLRASGIEDLQRLAEGDRKTSTSMTVHGNDNGWLAATEVEAMVGLHFMIREGYEELAKEAKRTGAPKVPASELYRLLNEPQRRRKEAEDALQSFRFPRVVFDPGARVRIPEVNGLKSFGLLRASVLDGHTVNAVAEAIVLRLGERMKEPVSAKPSWCLMPLREVRFDPTTEGMVQLYFPIEHAAAVAKNGIENLHQRPDTEIQSKQFRSEWRQGIEENLARMRFEQPKNGPDPWLALRPKSAILEIDWPADVEQTCSGGDRYGACVAVMKTSVYPRITVTPHDSGAMGPEKPYATPERLTTQVRPLSDGRTFVEGTSNEYLEAQIWGSITAADIQELWIRESEADAKTIRALASGGHPVYAFRDSNEGGRYRRVRTKRLV